MIPPSARVQVEPTVYSRAFGDELVLLDFARGEYYALDEVGAEIWKRIEAGDSLGTIAAAIARDYDVSEEQATRDISDLVAQLRDRGLVAIVSSPV